LLRYSDSTAQYAAMPNAFTIDSNGYSSERGDEPVPVRTSDK